MSTMTVEVEWTRDTFATAWVLKKSVLMSDLGAVAFTSAATARMIRDK